MRYTTELTPPVWFYLRGEEYSAQVQEFVTRVKNHNRAGLNTFSTARHTDEALALIIADAAAPGSGVARPPTGTGTVASAASPERHGWRNWTRRVISR